MNKIKKILNKNNINYEEFNFEDLGYDLIKVYQYPIDDLSEQAKLYSVQCTILKYKNHLEYEVGYNFDSLCNQFKIKKYIKAIDIYNELIKKCCITDKELMDINDLGKIEYIK